MNIKQLLSVPYVMRPCSCYLPAGFESVSADLGYICQLDFIFEKAKQNCFDECRYNLQGWNEMHLLLSVLIFENRH
jgi:hypothetical protein